MWRDISGFKRSLVSLAIALTLGGALLIGNDAVNPPGRDSENVASKIGAAPSLSTSFSAGREAPATTKGGYRQQFEQTLEQNKWSGASTRFGFSFIVAFLVAVVLRIFIKTTVIIASLGAGGLAFMVNQGWIDPFWNENIGFVETAAVWAQAQTDSVIDFLKGYLPSGFSAGVGFAMGIRK